jgi:hypothetical protein
VVKLLLKEAPCRKIQAKNVVDFRLFACGYASAYKLNVVDAIANACFAQRGLVLVFRSVPPTDGGP